MENSFDHEIELVRKAEMLLSSDSFSSATDAERYRALLDEYRALLRQTIRIVETQHIVTSGFRSISERLDRTSRMDALTELFNRRFFDQEYAKEWNSAFRSQTPLSLLMIDIDSLNGFNEEHGHLRGDECLRMISAVVGRSARRPRDLAARFGGEEFAVLLPETDMDGAIPVAQSVLSGIRALGIARTASRPEDPITVSIGVASEIPVPGSTNESLVEKAGAALIKAKNEGRNRIRIFD